MDMPLPKLYEFIEKQEVRISKLEKELSERQSPDPLPAIVPIKKAAEILGKTPNAIRIAISQGRLKSVKKGKNHYFETQYLMDWMAGKVDSKPKEDPSEILVSSR